METEVAARRVLDDAAVVKNSFTTDEREHPRTRVLSERLKTEQFFHNANLTVAKTAVEKLVKERSSDFLFGNGRGLAGHLTVAGLRAREEARDRGDHNVNANAQATAASLPPPDEYGRVLRGILDRDI